MPRTKRTLPPCQTLDSHPEFLNRLSETQYKCSQGGGGGRAAILNMRRELLSVLTILGVKGNNYSLSSAIPNFSRFRRIQRIHRR